MSITLLPRQAMESLFTIRYQQVIDRRGDSINEEGQLRTPTVDVAKSDDELIEDVQCGNREALGLLFRRYARTVRNVGQRVLRDNAEADDLLQEVFLYIYRKSELFDKGKGSARSWIVQVAYTQAFLRRRDLKSHGLYASGIADKALKDGPQIEFVSDYDRTVEGIFGRNRWQNVLDTLSQDQRETIRLHFFEGFTFEEIATELKQSYGNVRNHYYRGLEKLRRHLKAPGSIGR